MVHLLKESSGQGWCKIFISCCKFDGLNVFYLTLASSFEGHFLFLRHPGTYFEKDRVCIHCTLLFHSLLISKSPHLIWPLLIRFSEKFPTTQFLNPISPFIQQLSSVRIQERQKFYFKCNEKFTLNLTDD